MSEDPQTQLTRVQTAIAAIEEGGQDVTYGDRRVTMADLKTLYAREQSLIRQVARNARGGGMRVRRVTPIA